MKQFLQKINFQKYSLLYTVGLGILAYISPGYIGRSRKPAGAYLLRSICPA